MDAFNADVAAWGKATHAAASAQIAALGIVRTGAPFRVQNRKNAGMINRLSFRITKGLVMTHKGVGRGTKISQVGTTKRVAKPFLNPVIEQRLPELVEIAAEHQLSLIVNALTIR